MKKKILGLSILVGSAMLTGCIDPSSDNSSMLQNALKSIRVNAGAAYPYGELKGINQADIPGFENADGDNPTQVTVSVSSVPDGCLLFDSGISTFTGSSTSEASAQFAASGIDSTMVAMVCSAEGKTAKATISFTAGGKSYTATTILTS